LTDYSILNKNHQTMYRSAQLTIILLLFSGVIYAGNYFVSPNGNNNNSGLSLDEAFKTIQYAADFATPGDTVWVNDGVYNEAVTITNSGFENLWITFKAINQHKAVVSNSWGDCFKVDANYIVIDGFSLTTSAVYGSGIAGVQGRHHLTAINNYIHDCGQSGIQSWGNDYLTIENNVTTRNGWLMPHAGSGISIYGAFRSDNKTGIRNIIRNNISFSNDNGPNTAKTDGNGIIIDDLICSQHWHNPDVCKPNDYNSAQTLVEGNLCFDNGGRGIQIYLSVNIIIRNNTVYHNSTRQDESSWRGEIGVSNSDSLTIVNNIAVCNTKMEAPISRHNSAYLMAQYGGHSTKNIIFKNNLGFNTANPTDQSYRNLVGTANVIFADNLLATNPLFVLASADSTLANFRLSPESPAIDKGTLEYGFYPYDLDGNTRVMGASIDMGCYESLHETGLLKPFIREGNFHIYPNPSDKLLTLRNNSNHYSGKISARIIDMSGKTAMELCFEDSPINHINISSLSPGIYFLQAHNHDLVLLDAKFVKM
jgi:parallel beta-helix repeat protein